MAGYGSNDGAANNGFGQRSLHQWEGRLLYAAGYPAPPDFRAPRGWRLSAGGVPIPPPPQGAALDAAIDEILEGMSDEQRADPRFYPDNYPVWNTFFRRRYERELTVYDGPSSPPMRNNTAGRRHWWSAPDRTLKAVLTHIERGNSPVLGMPPPQPLTLSWRRGSSWIPRQMASRSSGSASARSASRSSASTPRTVKQEPPSAPPRRSSGALVIREGAHTSSPPHNRKRKPRKDDAKAASELANAEAARTEEAAMREAIAKLFADLVPADNAMPMDAASQSCSREAGLGEGAGGAAAAVLDLAQARRRAEAADLPARGTPVVKLEDSSNDDLYRPTTPRFDDAGQSSQPPPPRDDGGDSSDNDGGDYTRFYRHFGM
jgi:hypothetical protein